MASVGGIGAPVVGIEKIERGDECLRAMRAAERAAGGRVTALISSEIGGANSMEPMITGAQAGLPVVDGDGMGRAFPELQMCTFFIYGLKPSPGGDRRREGQRGGLHRRAGHVLAGAALARRHRGHGRHRRLCLPPMGGDFVRSVAVPGTVTQAIDLGYAVQDARAAASAIRCRRSWMRATACCSSRARWSTWIGGWRAASRWAAPRCKGLGGDSGATLAIDLQNENLIALRDGIPIATVPDLICMVDLESGQPITTEVLRYGLRVAVLGLPCHPLLRTPEALAVIGPRAFGYDLEYRPLAMGGFDEDDRTGADGRPGAGCRGARHRWGRRPAHRQAHRGGGDARSTAPCG